MQETADPGHAVAFHSAGGERAEVELAAARVLELLRDGVTPGDVAVVLPGPERVRVAARAGVRRLRHPVLDRPHAAARAHRARARPARADPLRPARTAPPTTCSPTCARPGLLRDAGLADRLEAEVRREGAHAAAEARARSGSATAGRSTSSTACARARHGRLRRRARAPARGACSPAPTGARATVLSGPELDEARAFVTAAEGAGRAARRAGRRRPPIPRTCCA